MFVAMLILVCQINVMWPWLNDEAAGAPTRWFPGMVNLLLVGGALALDGVLLGCMLGPFMIFHLKMAAKNETTIEGSTNPHFDVGPLQNLRSVFGRQMWTWPIPLYLNGPDGDGLHWPRTDGPRAVGGGTNVVLPSNLSKPSQCSSGSSSGAQAVLPVAEP